VPSLLLSNDLLLAQNVPPKAAPVPGVAQDSSPPSAGGGGSSGASPFAGLMPILMFLVIMVPFFLLTSRKQKKEAQARASLKKGDRVLTNAGLIGELVEMDDRVAKVKVAAGVTVQVVANTVSPFAEPEKAPAKALKEATSDKK